MGMTKQQKIDYFNVIKDALLKYNPKLFDTINMDDLNKILKDLKTEFVTISNVIGGAYNADTGVITLTDYDVNNRIDFSIPADSSLPEGEYVFEVTFIRTEGTYKALYTDGEVTNEELATKVGGGVKQFTIKYVPGTATNLSLYTDDSYLRGTFTYDLIGNRFVQKSDLADIGGAVDADTVNQLIADYLAANDIGGSVTYEINPKTIIERTGLTEDDVKALIAEYIGTIPNTQYKTSVIYKWDEYVPAYRGEWLKGNYGKWHTVSIDGVAISDDYIYFNHSNTKLVYVITHGFKLVQIIDIAATGLSTDNVQGVRVTPNSKRLVIHTYSDNYDANILTYEMGDNGEYQLLNYLNDYDCKDVYITPDGGTLIAALYTYIYEYKLSDQGQWENVFNVNLGGNTILSIACSVDGSEIYIYQIGGTAVYKMEKVDGVWSSPEATGIVKQDDSSDSWATGRHALTADKQVYYCGDVYANNNIGRVDVYYFHEYPNVLYPFENSIDPTISNTPFIFSDVSIIPGSGFSDVVKKYGTYAKVMGGDSDGLVIDGLNMASEEYTFNIFVYRTDHSTKNDGDDSIRDYALSFGGYWEDNALFFQIDNNDGEIKLYNNKSSDVSDVIGTAHAFNEWHMYTLVSTPTDTIVYLDGVKVYEDTTGRYNKFDNIWVTLGAAYQQVSDTDTTKEYMFRLNGYIDEFTIVNRVLTEDEIQNLYNGLNGKTWKYEKSIPHFTTLQFQPEEVLRKVYFIDNYYPLDSDVLDVKAINPLNPTVTGSVTFEPGKYGNCARFVNTDDGLLFDLEDRTLYAVTMYIKASDVTNEAMPIYWYLDDDNYGFVYFNNGYIKMGSTVNEVLNYDEDLPIPTDWFQLTVKVNGGIFVFIDGEYKKGLSISGANIKGELRVGYSNSDSYRFDGWIDELGFSTFDLSTEQIIALYTGNYAIEEAYQFGKSLAVNLDNSKLVVGDYNGRLFYLEQEVVLDAYSTNPFGDGSLKNLLPLDGGVVDIVGSTTINTSNVDAFVDAKFNQGAKMYSDDAVIEFDVVNAKTISLYYHKDFTGDTNINRYLLTAYDGSDYIFAIQIPNGTQNLIDYQNGTATKIYVNGVLHDQNSDILLDADDYYHIVVELSDAYTNNMAVGNLTTNHSSFGDSDFDCAGTVDHIQVFNRSLTEEEISKLYNAIIK